MTPIARSGYLHPNKAVLGQLLALEDLMGKNGVSAVLNLSGLKAWIDHYPPDILDKQIDFADVASIQLALEEIYGVRAGRNMARRSAWVGLQGLLGDLGALAPLASLARQTQPPQERMAVAMASFAKLMSKASDQACQVQPDGAGVRLTSRPCPHCWGRQAGEPICHAMVGALEGLCSLVAGEVAWSVQETTCTAAGAEDCQFLILPSAAG